MEKCDISRSICGISNTPTGEDNAGLDMIMTAREVCWWWKGGWSRDIGASGRISLQGGQGTGQSWPPALVSFSCALPLKTSYCQQFFRFPKEILPL